jgi:hypothetical protein
MQSVTSRAELISLVKWLTVLLETDDSFEGSLQYSVCGEDQFDVTAAIRFGNRDGQGFMRIIRGPEMDERCRQGMHSWIDDPSIRSGNCTRCNEPYGDPK